MSDQVEDLQARVESLDEELAYLKKVNHYLYRGIRKRSEGTFRGLPWYDIAVGPDPKTGQIHGHARGVIAIGEIATGVIAIGLLARGLIAVGVAALGVLVGFGALGTGVLAIGAAAIGLIAVGGGAIGIVAIGGGALGLVAIGGRAIGYYALGGGASGEYVIDSLRQDPEAIRFFKGWIPGLEKVLKQIGHG